MNFELQDRRIVVADSDRTVLELIQIRLDLVGCRTAVARTGPAALESIAAIRPAALVLELNLPELDGFEVLRALNARRDHVPIPILVMGRKLALEDIRHAVSLGARDCMIKPFSGADILERVTRLFHRPPLTPQRPTAALAPAG